MLEFLAFFQGFIWFYDVLCILLMESKQQSVMEFAVPSTSSPSQIVKLPYLGAPPQKSCFGRTCNACFFPMTDPRDWHIYLHERLILMVNVGTCSLHGSYGYNGIANYPSNEARKIQKIKRSAPAIPAAKQSLKLRRRVAVLDLSGTQSLLNKIQGNYPP